MWFEDDQESFITKQKFVKEIVEELGFIFTPPKREINGDNIDTIDFEEYDLMIADLNLESENGPQILEKIREKDILTEVVFYSSNGEDDVRRVLKEHQIDGAYCTGRVNSEFEEKVKKVILTTIKKVQDVNNMRGLIMAGTSDLDGIMRDIIEIILKGKNVDAKSKLIEKIFNDVESSVNEKSKKFGKFKEKSLIDKLMNDTMMFDANKKINAIQLLFDIINTEFSDEYKGDKFIKSYSDEINYYRNIFAHVKVVIDENGKKKLMSKNNEIEFTPEFCQDIRKKLIKYGTLLNGFHGHLSKES